MNEALTKHALTVVIDSLKGLDIPNIQVGKIQKADDYRRFGDVTTTFRVAINQLSLSFILSLGNSTIDKLAEKLRTKDLTATGKEGEKALVHFAENIAAAYASTLKKNGQIANIGKTKVAHSKEIDLRNLSDEGIVSISLFTDIGQIIFGLGMTSL